MPRYFAARIDPKTGRELRGSENGLFFEYAHVKNVIRFGLRKSGVLSGQWNIYVWPEGTSEPVTPKLVTAYRRVTSTDNED